MRKQTSNAAPEVRIAHIAGREHGVLDTSELLLCGLSHAGITRRIRGGRLHRLHHGVYAVGHAAISQEGHWLAAVKACGAGAALSHQSAAQLWNIAPRRAGPTHVTVPGHRRPRPGSGVRVHRSQTLAPSDLTRRDRIPVTSPSRTLRDLKRVLPRKQWEEALDRARLRGIDVSEVVTEAPTRSVLERKFLRICRRHRIPAPKVNVMISDYLVDFFWAEDRLIVEVDGYEYHRDRESFEADRARDLKLSQEGYRVARLTYRQVTEEPARVARSVWRLLRSAA